MSATVHDVRRFWDSLPIGVGVIPHEVGSRQWFLEFDRVKKEFGLSGVIEVFAPPVLSGQCVLDVGCGPGFWARHLIPMGAHYSGVDISARSVALAEQSLKIFGLHGALNIANAESLPFAAESFDAVVSEGVIHHTPDTQACIDEIHRVLRPGGRAVVSVYYRNFILRSPMLFKACTGAMRILRIGLSGRGREELVAAVSADEFVRIYDGATNPVGKAYSKRDLRSAFARFSSVDMRTYFLPHLPIFELMHSLPRRMIARRIGLMIAVIARK